MTVEAADTPVLFECVPPVVAFELVEGSFESPELFELVPPFGLSDPFAFSDPFALPELVVCVRPAGVLGLGLRV